MQSFDDNIDLDALFDMLNIGNEPAGKTADAAGKAFVSHLDPTTHQVQDLSPFEADHFIVDLPIDQS